MMTTGLSYQDAITDFRTVRRWSALWELLAWLTEKSINLLPYDGLSSMVQERDRSLGVVKEIPIASIRVLPGQYSDFTRIFRRPPGSSEAALPEKSGETGSSSSPGCQIVVYQIDQSYYLISGKHKLARALDAGKQAILANVLDCVGGDQTGSSPEVLILSHEWSEFVKKTHFDSLFPGIVLKLTFLGMYSTIAEHIAVHRQYMGLELKRPVGDTEALKHWYETVYSPVIHAIEEHGLLHEFQGLTEADLYLWVADRRLAVQKEIGWSLRPPVGEWSMANQMSPRLTQVVTRVRERITDELIPAIPFTHRDHNGMGASEDCLFHSILVPLSGHETGWTALRQALFVAKQEGSALTGLHVLANEESVDHLAVRALCDKFTDSVRASQTSAEIVFAPGDISKEISEHAKTADLLVVNLAHPPSPELMTRIGAGFHAMIKRCGRPVLAVPGQAQPVERILLAYDGSPKGNEALFLSAYLSSKWGVPLCVLTVIEKDRLSEKPQEIARRYLVSHAISATYLSYQGDVVDIFLNVAHEQGVNLLIIGGYSFSPVVDSVFGSTVDKVLRKTDLPVLICQ